MQVALFTSDFDNKKSWMMSMHYARALTKQIILSNQPSEAVV